MTGTTRGVKRTNDVNDRPNNGSKASFTILIKQNKYHNYNTQQ